MTTIEMRPPVPRFGVKLETPSGLVVPPLRDVHIVDEEEERDWRVLKEISQRRHIPILEGRWMLECFIGGQLYHRHRERAHSATRNLYNHVFSQGDAKNISDTTFGAGKLSFKDTAGVVQHGALTSAIGGNNDILGGSLLPNAADAAFGIIVGSDTTAFDFEQYHLLNAIPNGTTNDGHHLSYIASELHSVAYDSPSKTLTDTLIRFLNNNTGGNVDVNEVCLVYSNAAGLWLVMPERTKLGSTTTVLNTAQLKVTYSVSLTYPA